MPLNNQDVIKKGILKALISCFRNQTNARVLLTAIGFPTDLIPDGSGMDFWSSVCEEIENGAVEGGFEALIEAAAERYPGNPVFAQYRMPTAEEPPQENRDAISIMVTGWDDPQHLIDTARRVAHDQGLPDNSISLGFANMEGVLLNLTGWTGEQALALAKALDTAPQPGGAQPHSTVATNEFRDYLIRQLFVEGPDQARFEISDVRASTKVGDIAQGVINTEYGDKLFGGAGGGRRTTVDQVKEDGSTVRCDPDKTLHDSDIREGDTLQVAPESTAGSINPNTRDEALARVRSQIVHYAESHPGFLVAANARQTPTEYTFKFKAPSFAPPPTPDSDLVEINAHEVFLVMPPDFPMMAPGVFWQTPIFHPNVDPKYGEVCLGDLGDHFRPGMNFGDLCQMLVDIASYQNYAAKEGYNLAAQDWAVSKEGQIAIEKIGGKSVIRKLIDKHTTPRPLHIKRL
jgi:ubiquitin-protein ligase